MHIAYFLPKHELQLDPDRGWLHLAQFRVPPENVDGALVWNWALLARPGLAVGFLHCLLAGIRDALAILFFITTW